MNDSVLVLGLDKQYFQDKFEIFHSKYKSINSYMSWNPINPKLEISKIKRIDLSLLYNQERIFEAYKFDQISVLGSDFLSNMYECESVFFSTIDRCSVYFSYKVNYNKNYFYDLLSFFKSFFENNKNVKFVFFPTTPHFPVDIVLFYVAKYFSVKTIILNRTDLNNKFYFRNDWRNTHLFNENINYKSIYNISKEQLKVDSDFVKYSQTLNKSSLDNFIDSKNILDKLIEYYKLLKVSYNYYKQRDGASVSHLNKKVSLYDVIKIVFKRYNENKILKKYYKSKMIEPEINSKYLYFPLHFQPERSTTPEGIFFSNQIKAVELLRKILDKSIKIYVKEHPRQFDNYGSADIRKRSSRSIMFYKKIIDLKETYLIDLAYDSKKLIKNSTIIATISGSSGWQGIIHNKPVIVFGKPWYSNYKWCYHIDSEESGLIAIKNINAKINDSKKNDLENYLKNIEHELFEAYIGSVYFNKDVLDYNKIINVFADNLIKYMRS